MIGLGSRVLYHRQSGPACGGAFCFCGTVTQIIAVEIIQGVWQERYLVVGDLDEEVLARIDELKEGTRKTHGTNRHPVPNGKEDLGVLPRLSA